MQILFPDYYHKFHCLAGNCPDSCCKDWAVQIDEDSARRYRALPGNLGNALRENLKEEDGETVLALTPEGRCPMWQQDGLCRIHAELGENLLCHTCKNFPRLRHEYGDFTELGLELSCPEAARFILSGLCQYTAASASGGEPPEYNPEIMSTLLRSRKTALNLIADPTFSIGEALAVLLLYGYAVQEELDGGTPAQLDIASALNTCRKIARPGDPAQLLNFYKNLEILTPTWRQLLDSPAPTPWQDAHRAMAQYLIMRYWLQTISDFDLVGRVKFCIVSCLVTKLVGGDLLRTAQLYSKEIENDLDNVYAILDGAYTEPALADVALLGYLLE